MAVKKRLYRWSISGLVLLSLLTLSWEAAADEPSIISAKIGNKELKGTNEVTIIREDLTNRREILVVGTADGGGVRVEKVEVSLNGGQTWKEATGGERWQYEFPPLPNYTYHLAFRVTNADGIVSNPEKLGITQLTYLPLTLSELIQQQADELAKAYMSKDLERYMGFISRDYRNYPSGWHRLRRSIENDFRSLNNIVLRFTVNQVFELEGVIMADIHWRLTHAGLIEPKEGYVEIHFDPADQLKILVQKKDLYFGAAVIGHDGGIQVNDFGTDFIFVVTDLDKVGARRITIRVRIIGTAPFNGSLTLNETPPRSGRFVGSRYGSVAPGDRAEATYIDEITSDWRRNVRRIDTNP
jgi:hypothetical protein